MMNGIPNHSNDNFQYHTNSVQSQIYPPNTQNIDYNSRYYGNNYDIQHQNTIPTPQSTCVIDDSMYPNNCATYSNYQNAYIGNSVEPPLVPVNCGYENQVQTTFNNNDRNHVYHNTPLPLPPLNHKPTCLPQLQPQFQQKFTNYAKPHLNSQSPAILTEHMKNLQLDSSPLANTIDLMQTRDLFDEVEDNYNTPKTNFSTNCDPNIMQCTLNTIPIESNMLSKSRLPFGVHIQPFRDSDITLVQTNTIVRCRSCRTYINPFVTLTDHQRRWHCNVCGRVNDIPDEFMYDPVTKTYGSPTKRPELTQCNIEYTANPDYTVRPPMATMYVFCLDVSQAAITSGYLRYTCDLLIDNLHKMPGDGRKQIAFLTYNSGIQFYQIHANSFKSLNWSDISEVEIPVSEDLLVNVNDRKEIILDFLRHLPSMFPASSDTGNCLGYTLQVAMKLISHNGGRITVVNASMPNAGPGSLTNRQAKESESKLLQPATDFYKSLALQCANDQISVDLFCINRQYSDIASYSSISRHSSGGFYYYGNFKALVHENQRLESLEQLDFDRFTKDFTRYLTRKIGLEAVMRTRCSKGLDLTAFHGNLFMRSTNVIALPIVNPDASYTIQFKINGTLSDWSHVIVQAALLYTTSESDRRIRVHTICLPLADKLDAIFHSANASAIAALIGKIAIDKCVSDGLRNVREAFVNSIIDPLKTFNSLQNQSRGAMSLLCPRSLRQLAPFVVGLLRNTGFRDHQTRVGESIDEQVAMLESLRWLPLADVLRRVYPRLAPLTGQTSGARLALTAASLSSDALFLLDAGSSLYVIVGPAVAHAVIQASLGHDSISHVPRSALVTDLHGEATSAHDRTVAGRTLGTTAIIVLHDDVSLRAHLVRHLVDDRGSANGSAMSYFEVLKSIHGAVCGGH